MKSNGGSPVDALVNHVNMLREPYRRNAIQWLEHCTRRPLTDVRNDLFHFLDGLAPSVRDRFVIQTKLVLEDAVRYFGDQA